MKTLIYIISLLLLVNSSDPLSRAKSLIGQQKYNMALATLQNSSDDHKWYFVGWCHYKMGNCGEAQTAFQQFLSLNQEETMASWRMEAKHLIENCGSIVKASYASPNNQNSNLTIGRKYFKEEYIDSLYLSGIKEEKEEWKDNGVETTGQISFVIPRYKFDSLMDVGSNPKGQVITIEKGKSNPQDTNISEGSKPIVTKTKPVGSLEDMDDDIEEATISSIDQSDHYKIFFAASKESDKIYLSLADIGPVIYKQGKDGLYLYYLGNFETQVEAERIVERVRRSGFPDAKVIHFDQGRAIKQEATPKPEFEEKEKRKPEIVASKKPAQSKETPKPKIVELEVKEVITYHVLFRGLDNPYEEFPELKHLGPLFRDTYDREGNTRYLIGEAFSMEEAEALLEKVKKAGYPISFIASYMNGQLLKTYD